MDNSLALLMVLSLAPPDDLPLLEELGRFPPRSVVKEARAFNGGFRACLEAREHLEPWRNHWESIAECRRLYKIWDILDDAQYSSFCEATKRYKLQQLREMLGERDWLLGQMPPCVPPSACWASD